MASSATSGLKGAKLCLYAIESDIKWSLIIIDLPIPYHKICVMAYSVHATHYFTWISSREKLSEVDSQLLWDKCEKGQLWAMSRLDSPDIFPSSCVE